MSLIETRILKLKTISPIHIKGKDIDYGQGFVRRDEQTAYAVDINKLAEFLVAQSNDLTLVENYLLRFEESIKSRQKDGFTIEKFLSDNNIYHCKNNTVHKNKLIEADVFKSVVNAIKETDFIKNGYSKAYIPGSSIKGMIRTAVMFKIAEKLKNEAETNKVKDFLENISNKIIEFETAAKGKDKREINILKGKFSKELQEFIFQTTKFISPKAETVNKANRDFFRCIKVKDSSEIQNFKRVNIFVTSMKKAKKSNEIIKEDLTDKIGKLVSIEESVAVEYQNKSYDFTNKVYRNNIELLKKNIDKFIFIKEFSSDKVKDFEIIEGTNIASNTESNNAIRNYSLGYKLDKNTKEENKPIEFDAEVFEGGTTIEISIDHSILDSFRKDRIPFKNIDELLNIINDFGNKVWKFEKTFFDNCNDDNLNLAEIRTFYQKEHKNIFRLGWGTGLSGLTLLMLLKEDKQKEMRNRLFIDREDFPAPKSRKLIFENEQPNLPLGWMTYEY